MVFGGTQVLMDVEPLVRIFHQDTVLHGLTHTVLGAFGIGIAAGAAGKPVSEILLRWAAIQHAKLTWRVSFLSAFVGSFSHIALDAIMHADMRPLWPLAEGNPLLGVVPVAQLHVFCLICGLLGIALLSRHLVAELFRRR